MKLGKINQSMLGAILVFAGILTIYFEHYRNNQILEFVSIAFVFLGWGLVFIKFNNNTERIAFSTDKPKWLQPKLSGFLRAVIIISLVGGTIYYAFSLADSRVERILNEGPSETTIAEVNGVETHHGRNSTTYDAIFQYKAGNEIIAHPVRENSDLDYIVSQKYEIRYSVEYPEMFRILKKIP